MGARIVLALLLALALTSCAQNAIFELHVDLPALAAPGTTTTVGTARFARVQILPGTASFGVERLQWLTPAIPLTTTAHAVMVSVPADGSEITQGLHVKVQLCDDEPCTHVVNERWYAFDRVFYQGRFTCYEVGYAADLADSTMSAPMLGDPDTSAIPVDRCAVTGCVSGNELSLHNCSTDGRHFCESGGSTTAAACDLIRDRDTQL